MHAVQDFVATGVPLRDDSVIDKVVESNFALTAAIPEPREDNARALARIIPFHLVHRVTGSVVLARQVDDAVPLMWNAGTLAPSALMFANPV
ncbi:MAG: hypothetical protein ABI867_10145 [Kofleriaceae bacterium]